MTETANWIVGLDPTTSTPEPAPELSAAPRVRSLDGAVIGLISNGKGKATPFLEALYDEIATQVPVSGKVLVEKESVYAIPTRDDWARVIAQATVGITGYGG